MKLPTFDNIIIPAPDFEIEFEGRTAKVYSPDYRAEFEVIQFAQEKRPANWLMEINPDADAQHLNPRRLMDGERAGWWMWKLVYP